MPEASGEGTAAAEREHRAWAFALPTQAHIRAAGDAAGAAALAAADATAAAAKEPRGAGGGDATRLAKLKADLLRVEATLPRGALVGSWDAPAWRQVSARRTLATMSLILLGRSIQRLRTYSKVVHEQCTSEPSQP